MSSRDLLVDFLQQFHVPLLGTSVWAVNRRQVEWLGPRGSAPATPYRAIAFDKRGAGTQISEARAMSFGDEEPGASTISAAGTGLEDWGRPKVLQACCSGKRGLWRKSGLLHRQHPHAVVVNEMAERS
jgi:hypothetical protein